MTGSISTLGQALTNIRLLNEQNTLFSTLSTQLATGKKTQTFSGLQAEGLTSQRTRTNFNALDTYNNNIINADIRINAMLTAIEEFKAQAEIFSNALVGFSQEGIYQEGDIITYDDPLTPADENTQVGVTSATPETDLQTLQALAGNIYSFITDLVNTKENDRFLLGGSDTLTQPLVDAGTLDSAISSLLGNWKDETLPAATNLTSDELISALTSRTFSEDPNAITDTTIGFSAALSAGNVGDVFVRVGETSEIEYTALANEQPFRDILVAISYFKNPDLTPIADVFAEPYTLGDPAITDGAPGATLQEMKENFFQVFNAMNKMVNEAIDDIDQIRFRLESARARIDTLRISNQEQQSALLTTISNTEDVDINDIAVKIQSLQVQLEASYRVTALSSELTLVRFL